MNGAKPSRIALGLGLAGAVAIPMLACGAPHVTPPGPPSAFPAGCGMTMFEEPPCEAQADAQCCSQQDQCAHDADCTRLAQCWFACDKQAKTMKARGQPGACGCFLNCYPQGKETRGAKPFGYLIACLSSGLNAGVSCGSQC